MGMEAVETILKAIQGAKDRRATGEEAAARLAYQREQLQQAKDEAKFQENKFKQEHELAVRVAEATMAGQKLDQSKKLMDIVSGVEQGGPTPPDWQNADPRQLLAGRKLPLTFPQPGAEGEAQSFSEVSQPGPNEYRQFRTPQGMVQGVRTPEMLAAQAGQADLLKNKPIHEFDQGLKTDEAKRVEGVTAEAEALKTTNQTITDAVKHGYDMELAAFNAAEAKKRSDADHSSAMTIAQLKQGTDLDITKLLGYADDAEAGKQTLDAMAKFLEKPEIEAVESIIQRRGSIVPREEQNLTAAKAKAVAGILKNYQELLKKVPASRYDMQGFFNNIMNTPETRAIADQIEGSKTTIGAILNYQGSQLSGSEAQSAVKQYVPSPAMFGGSGDSLQKLIKKYNNLNSTYEGFIRAQYPGAPDSQIVKIMSSLGLEHFKMAEMPGDGNANSGDAVAGPSKAQKKAAEMYGTSSKKAESTPTPAPKNTTPLMLQNPQSPPRKRDPNQNPLIVR